MARTSAEILQDMENVRKERARLVTDQPAGWQDEYPKLQKQATDLAREWQEAKMSEEKL